MGVEAVVGTDRRQALEDLQPGRTLTLDLAHPDRAADGIVAFAARHPLCAVVPTDDLTADSAARAAARLGLPHNPPEAALAARRKDLLRHALSAGGIPTPRHRLLPPEVDPGGMARDQTYPCVLKPLGLSASRGVIRADDPAAFIAAVRRIRSILVRPDVLERLGDTPRAILIEEFIPGGEVAVEGLLVRGELTILAIFDKPDPLEGPYFEETIYVTPSRRPSAEQETITRTTAAAARAVGLVEGPLHAELRLGAAGPVVLELAARSIGGLCSRALRFGTGLTLEEVIIAHALGRDVASLQREAPAAGVMMIPIPRTGVLREVRGQEAARAVDGIVDLTISATPGKPIETLPEGSSYLGFLFARAGTPDEVEKALRAAHAHLSIVIDPTL